MTGGGGASVPLQAAAQVCRKCVEFEPSQAAWCRVTPMARARLADSSVACKASSPPPSGSAGTSGAILETSLGSSVVRLSMSSSSAHSATVKVTASPGR
uniref:Uncharacterized protein n=1 Tax=Setaria italica TaxID=4555 RepID=K3XNJ9_SETIT